MSIMTHLIRNTATNQYFDHGDWTPDMAKAQRFDSPLSAISFSIRNRLKDAELVVVIGGEPSARDIHLALPEDRGYGLQQSRVANRCS